MEERRADCKAHLEKTTEIKLAVFGNGKPGLAYEMVSIKTKMNILITLNILIFGGFITMAYALFTSSLK